MILNGFIDKDTFYKLIDEKLNSFGITDGDYPLNSLKILEMQLPKIQLEYIDFDSINIGSILYKNEVQSFMALNSSRSKKGMNFDCMHELIHYWFHPYIEYICSDNKRKPVQNKGLEWQANEGAAQALMPKNLFIQKYKDFKGEISSLSTFFLVGEKAVVYRMLNLKLDDMFIFLEATNRDILKMYTVRICPICRNSKIDINSQFCSACGQYLDTLIIKNPYDINYYGYKLDNYMKLEVCPNCLNYDIDKNDVNCKVCGLHLYNDCINDSCTVTKLPGDTRCCPQCGADTTFTHSDLLKPWEYSLVIQFNKLGFEQNLFGEGNNICKISNWPHDLQLSLKKNKHIGKLLEHTTSSIAENTLVIWVPKQIIKENLNTDKNLEIIMNTLDIHFGITIDNIKIACLEALYPVDTF